MPPAERTASVHLRVDPDVLRWFKGEGRGYLNPHERRPPDLRRGQPEDGIVSRNAVPISPNEVIA